MSQHAMSQMCCTELMQKAHWSINVSSQLMYVVVSCKFVLPELMQASLHVHV